MTEARTTVYTDGACVGNPGPGGWAWAVPGGRWRSGAEASSTNQRMEISAALDAARTLEGPLEVVSDSTYVVNCFRARWWEKWVANGWKNAARQPVANDDLWKPLVALYRAAPGRLSFRWVKGHSTDPFNDLVDRLAVAAANSQRGQEGDEPPGPGALGPADAPGGRAGHAPGTASGPALPGLPAARGTDGPPGPVPLPGLGPAAGVRLRLARGTDAQAVLHLWREAGAHPSVTDDLAGVRGIDGPRPRGADRGGGRREARRYPDRGLGWVAGASSPPGRPPRLAPPRDCERPGYRRRTPPGGPRGEACWCGRFLGRPWRGGFLGSGRVLGEPPCPPAHENHARALTAPSPAIRYVVAPR